MRYYQWKLSQKDGKPSKELSINAVVRKDQTKSKLADFLHIYVFILALSIFQQAIRNKILVTWPAIDTINFEKFVNDKTAL